MESHMANETRYAATTGGPGATVDRLVHLLLTDECLGACGVDVGALRALGARRRAAGHAAARGRDAFRPFAELQVRRHATGLCDEWRRVDAAYVGAGALAGVLVPAAPGHPRAFRAARPDGGGLFVSLPVLCDARGRFDPFDCVALRLCLTPADGADGADYPEFADVVLTYEEALPEGTRYDADAPRLGALCRQFLRYADSLPAGRLGPAGEALRDKLEALLAEGARGPGEVDATSVAEAASGGPYDDPDAAARVRESDREIGALIRRAADALNRRRPLGRGRRPPVADADEPPAAPRRAGVVSGLRQGALAHVFCTAADGAGGGADGRRRGLEQAAVLEGLEPAGRGRFAGGTPLSRRLDALDAAADGRAAASVADALEDVLLFDAGERAPLGPANALGLAFALLAGGDTPADAWRRRPVSVVARSHFATGRRFFVLSYEPSVAWGGRGGAGGRAVGAESLARALVGACAAEGVSRPAELSDAAKRALAAEAPSLAYPLGLAPRDAAAGPGGPPPLAPFSVGAEAGLRAAFHAACASAAARALGAALRSSPRLRQALSYDMAGPADEEFARATAARAPALVAACVAAVAAEAPGRAFERSALAAAALARAATRSGAAPPHRNYATGLPATRPDCCYPDSAGGSGGDGGDEELFVFDYYSAGGECVRLSDRPVPVLVERGAGTPRGAPRSPPRKRKRTATTSWRRAREGRDEEERNGDGGEGGEEPPPPRRRSCAFPTWFRPRGACERYLPGETFAYACVGYDARLRVLLVLPGGFALEADAGPFFDEWPAGRAAATLARLCRRDALPARVIGAGSADSAEGSSLPLFGSRQPLAQ